jgi:Flp pilus assembly protein CpaB
MTKRKKSSVIFLVVAVICGVIAALLTGTVLTNYTQVTDVLVVTEDIGQYEPIDSSLVSKVEMPAAAVPSDAVLDVGFFEGKFTRTGLAAGDVLRKAHLADDVPGGGAMAARLTYTEGPDKRALALPNSSVITVGGTVTKGDTIDLIAVLTISEGDVRSSNAKTIGHGVKVLDVISPEQGDGAIIVVVEPKQAEELVFLMENGKVYAVLNPYDVDKNASITDGFYNSDTFIQRHSQFVGDFFKPDFGKEDDEDDFDFVLDDLVDDADKGNEGGVE